MDAIAENRSALQVKHRICLTNLIPAPLKMVFYRKIFLSPAVGLSDRRPEEPQNLLTAMEREACTPLAFPDQQMKFLNKLEKLYAAF